MGKRELVAKRPRKLASYAVAGNAAQVKFVLKGRRKGSPQMFCVESHAVFFQKQLLFILKGGGPVMLDLMGNIFLHRRAIGNAHREGAITGLPGEIFHADRLVNPARRGLFEVLDQGRQRMRGAHADQQMDMIGRAANGFGNAVGRAN